MNQTSNVLDRAEAIRQRTLGVIRALTKKAKECELPEPLYTFEQYRQKLQENTYQVLVVGEAKRGKSTFVNALIGRNRLPIDVDIATSQVFRVCAAEQEAYRLRFEDDSQMAITADDLARYGSQILAHTETVPRLDQIIRWIEVDVPVTFLPRGVCILDTPGLGALYAAHPQITQRFVPHADAVIFVLDSQAPISEPEMRFVETILEVMPDVLFIQTKIDQFHKESWQAIQQRNQAILQQRFGSRLPRVRVWPISSTNLQKAAMSGDEDYLLVSRHKELAAALKAFLFRVAGWGRSAQAVVLAEHYHGQSRKVLEQRLSDAKEESREKRAETQQLAMERRRQFESDWGERGHKRRELLEGVQNASALAKQEFRQALQPAGAIENGQREKIERLQSVGGAKEYVEAMPAQVTEEVLLKWRAVCAHFQAHCLMLLDPFLTDLEKSGLAGDAPHESPGQLAAFVSEIDADQFARFKAAWSDFAAVGTAGGLGVSIISTIIATSLLPPVALAALGAAVWAGVRGWKSAGLRQLKQAQHMARDALGRQLQQIRSFFFDVDLASRRASRVEEYFASVESSVSEQIARLTTRKLEETQADLHRLLENARLSDEQRKTRIQQLHQQLEEWNGLGQEINGIQLELRELEQFGASETAGS